MHDTKYLNVADTQKSRVTVVSDTHVQHALASPVVLTLHKASTWPAKARADTYIIRTEHTEHLSPRDRGDIGPKAASHTALPSWAIKDVCLKINLQKFTYATRDRG